jgi:hypothetical protein
MPLSKQAQLAQARRQLRRLEEDAEAFRRGIVDMPVEHRKPMLRWFQGIVQQQRNAVRQLEKASDEHGRARRASAA